MLFLQEIEQYMKLSNSNNIKPSVHVLLLIFACISPDNPVFDVIMLWTVGFRGGTMDSLWGLTHFTVAPWDTPKPSLISCEVRQWVKCVRQEVYWDSAIIGESSLIKTGVSITPFHSKAPYERWKQHMFKTLLSSDKSPARLMGH